MKGEVLCKHCGKLILADNYLIHEARCALVSSRPHLPEELEKREMNQESSSLRNSGLRHQ